MPITARYIAECDECGRWTAAERDTKAAAMKEAEGCGWQVTLAPTGETVCICPKCQSKKPLLG